MQIEEISRFFIIPPLINKTGFGKSMRRLDKCCMVMGTLLLAGCADFATPIAVLPSKPAHEGQEPTNIGIACTHKFLWVFSFGDSHIRVAKKNGDVTEIATVEVTKKVIFADSFPFNVYRKQCTEVSGYS